MRKIVSMILITVMMFTMAIGLAGCGEKADYDTPQNMYDAHAGGQDVIGKTVDVIVNHDPENYGMIFDGPAHNLGPTIYMKVTGKGADKIKHGDDIIVKVKEIEYESRFSVSFICETTE